MKNFFVCWPNKSLPDKRKPKLEDYLDDMESHIEQTFTRFNIEAYSHGGIEAYIELNLRPYCLTSDNNFLRLNGSEFFLNGYSFNAYNKKNDALLLICQRFAKILKDYPNNDYFILALTEHFINTVIETNKFTNPEIIKAINEVNNLIPDNLLFENQKNHIKQAINKPNELATNSTSSIKSK